MKIQGDKMSYQSEHFSRYINFKFWRENYEGIIKTGFDFPRIFISCIMHYSVDREKITKLLDTHYTIPQKEDEYYPLLKLKNFTEEYPEFKDLLKPCTSNYENSVALIFTKPSSMWGLRGDPYFWRYLEELFIGSSIPMNVDELEDIIILKYHSLSGGKKIGERAYIKEFAHGGMSSGTVSEIWLELIPLLKYRLINLNNNYYLNHGEDSKIINNPEKIIKPTRISFDEILEEYDEPLWIWGYHPE